MAAATPSSPSANPRAPDPGHLRRTARRPITARAPPRSARSPPTRTQLRRPLQRTGAPYGGTPRTTGARRHGRAARRAPRTDAGPRVQQETCPGVPVRPAPPLQSLKNSHVSTAISTVRTRTTPAKITSAAEVGPRFIKEGQAGVETRALILKQDSRAPARPARDRRNSSDYGRPISPGTARDRRRSADSSRSCHHGDGARRRRCRSPRA